VTEIVDIFKLIISREFVGQIAADKNHYAQQYKNSEDNILSRI
jgi:hypothetical protein